MSIDEKRKPTFVRVGPYAVLCPGWMLCGKCGRAARAADFEVRGESFSSCVRGATKTWSRSIWKS
jgi:hypothetical protein